MSQHSDVTITWPQVEIGPLDITESQLVNRDAYRYTLSRKVRAVYFNGIFPVMTFPGHEGPCDA